MILIQGAGPAGLTLAGCLEQVGLPWRLIEQRTSLRAEGAGIGLQPNAHRILEALELGRLLQGCAEPIQAVHMGPWQRPRRLAFPANGGRSAQPAFQLGLHRADLQALLLKAVPAERIETGCSIRNWKLSDDGVDVQLTTGERLHASHLIAADGINSGIRETLRGLGDLRMADQWCWRTIVQDQPLGQEAREWLASGSRLGVMPLGQQRSYLYLVSAGIDRERVPNDPDACDLSQFGPEAQPLARALDPTVPWLSHPLSDRPVFWGQDRVILIGDAAHPITPNLGQGAGLGMEDAWLLARHLRAGQASAERLAALRDRRIRQLRARSWRAGQLLHRADWPARSLVNGLLRCLPNALFAASQRQVVDAFLRDPDAPPATAS